MKKGILVLAVIVLGFLFYRSFSQRTEVSGETVAEVETTSEIAEPIIVRKPEPVTTTTTIPVQPTENSMDVKSLLTELKWSGNGNSHFSRWVDFTNCDDSVCQLTIFQMDLPCDDSDHDRDNDCEEREDFSATVRILSDGFEVTELLGVYNELDPTRGGVGCRMTIKYDPTLKTYQLTSQEQRCYEFREFRAYSQNN